METSEASQKLGSAAAQTAEGRLSVLVGSWQWFQVHSEKSPYSHSSTPGRWPWLMSLSLYRGAGSVPESRQLPQGQRGRSSALDISVMLHRLERSHLGETPRPRDHCCLRSGQGELHPPGLQVRHYRQHSRQVTLSPVRVFRLVK